MPISDLIKGPLANILAKKKSNDLKKAVNRKTKNPAQQKKEYDIARKAMLGKFSGSRYPICQACVIYGKAQRRKERLKLIEKAAISCPEHFKKTIERLQKNMNEVEYMRCAKHVYLKNEKRTTKLGKKLWELGQQPPAGFLEPTDAQLAELGLTNKDLNAKGSKFRAAVYIKDPAVWGKNPEPKAVIAFRGSTPALKDWENNFSQDSGKKSAYYKKAVKIGNKLAKNNADIHIVGHSLGGGLASAAQGGSGLTASTYNSSGLHPETVAKYSKDNDHKSAEANKITAIRLKGEVLTKKQESGFIGILANNAVGTKQDIDPSTTEKEFKQLKAKHMVDKEEDYAGYLHGMDQMILSTEKLMQNDEALLKSC